MEELGEQVEWLADGPGGQALVGDRCQVDTVMNVLHSHLISVHIRARLLALLSKRQSRL